MAEAEAAAALMQGLDIGAAVPDANTSEDIVHHSEAACAHTSEDNAPHCAVASNTVGMPVLT